MKQKSIYILVLVVLVTVCLVKWCDNGDRVAKDDGVLEIVDDTLHANPAESVLVYGRLGDGTGMSCLEFITSRGDTMMLDKVSEYTGREADIVGTVSANPSYVYAIAVTDKGESADVVINMTELRASWVSYGRGFVLGADNKMSSLGSNAPVYKRWSLDRNRLLLCREATLEGGVTEIVDTMRLVYLDADTLEVVNNLGESVKYAHP